MSNNIRLYSGRRRPSLDFNIKLGRLLLLAFACCVAARADSIVVGVLSFDNLIPRSGNAAGVNTFTIQNFTGSNSQPGTPDSIISFLNTTLVLNGTSNVNVSRVDPGAVQPPDLQFPTTTEFTDATLDATLSTPDFTINGENYVASSTTLTADLQPSTPPDLQAGTDFVVLVVDAAPQGPAAPEPASVGMLLISVIPFLILRLPWRSLIHRP